jgi:TrmH family RNA methyltransferase
MSLSSHYLTEYLTNFPDNRTLKSSNNATIKKWQKEYLTGNEWILLEGLHLIEMYSTRYSLPPILVLSKEKSITEEIITFLSKFDDASQKLWKAELTALKQLSSLNTPPPIIAIAQRPQNTPSLQTTLTQHSSLWLDNIQDPGNCGTLLRTALGTGVTRIVAGHGTADLWSPKVLRAAQGAHAQLEIWQKIDLVELASKLPDLPKWGAVIGGENYHSLKWPSPVALILGNEGQGIHQNLHKVLSQKVGIPLHPQLDSLNVAIAGALLLFEQVRP